LINIWILILHKLIYREDDDAASKEYQSMQ